MKEYSALDTLDFIKLDKIYHTTFKFTEYKTISAYGRTYLIGSGEIIKSPSAEELRDSFLLAGSQVYKDINLLRDVLKIGKIVYETYTSKIPPYPQYPIKKSTYKEGPFLPLIMGFCEKYGLNSFMIKNLTTKKNIYGFDYLDFILDSYLIYNAFNSRHKHKDNDNSILFDATGHNRISLQFHYDKKSKKIKTDLFASSLISVAQFQLLKVIDGNINIRKCANHLCDEYIAGRSDKKTCGPACRQALKRQNEK